MIDSHCHLDQEPLINQISEVINRSKNVGVEKILTISTSFDSFGKILDGIGLNKNRPVLNTAINAALNSIFVDGTYAKLLAKWNLEGASL